MSGFKCRLYKTQADYRKEKHYAYYLAKNEKDFQASLKDPMVVPGTVFAFEVVEALPLLKDGSQDPSKPVRVYATNRQWKYVQVKALR